MGPLGLHQLGRALAAKGRGKDRHVVHVNDEEIKLLLAHGGRGSINPSTGLLEFDMGGGEDGSGAGGADGGPGGGGMAGADAGGGPASAAGMGAMADASLGAGMAATANQAGVSSPDGLSAFAGAGKAADDSLDAGMTATAKAAGVTDPGGMMAITSPSLPASLIGALGPLGKVAGLALDSFDGHISTAKGFAQEAVQTAFGLTPTGALANMIGGVLGMFGYTQTPDNTPLGPQSMGGDPSAVATSADPAPAASLATATPATPSNAYLARGT